MVVILQVAAGGRKSLLQPMESKTRRYGTLLEEKAVLTC